jgi:hypothetical protein
LFHVCWFFGRFLSKIYHISDKYYSAVEQVPVGWGHTLKEVKMTERSDRETVIVDNGERRSHSGLITLLVVLALIILFFMFGGFSLFNGGGASGGSTTNVNVTPTTTGAGTGQ